MIKWFEHIPEYYKQSPQMQAIYNALRERMPDVEDDMWKAFFLHMNSPQSKDLWMKELDVKNENELQAKLQARGVMNKEQTDTQNFHVKEFWRDMPEDGLNPSEFGVMADGHEYSPMTSLIYTTPETIDNAKHLVKMMRLAGFEYFFAVMMESFVKSKKAERPAYTRTLYLGDTRPHFIDDGASGTKLLTVSPTSLYLFADVDAQKKTSFSPFTLFNDETVFFTDIYSTREISEVSLHYTSKVDVKPSVATSNNQLELKHKVVSDGAQVNNSAQLILSPERINAERKASWSEIILFSDTGITFLHDTRRTQVSLVKISN